MKLNKLFLGLVGISMAFASCTSDFDAINTAPNNPTPDTVDPKQQLIFIQARGITYSNTWQSQDQELISTFCEYYANDPLSASDYNIDERYISGLWNNSYVVIANANSIIKSNQDKPTLMPFANVAASFSRNAADVAANNPNAYIKRLFYPTDEYTVNEANVREAEGRMGGNNKTSNNVWWDVD